MSPELRERIIEVLEAVLFDGGCIICGKAGHTPDCKLIACLEALKAERPVAVTPSPFHICLPDCPQHRPVGITLCASDCTGQHIHTRHRRADRP
jgi:hypothetical protein